MGKDRPTTRQALGPQVVAVVRGRHEVEGKNITEESYYTQIRVRAKEKLT